MTRPSVLRFRQVHLDFHTSEKISGVGSRFSADNFAENLKRGHVDSITLFSKCHHGMSYHDTQVGVRHPGMTKELLPRQLEVCRDLNVKTPIYVSAGFDEAMARAHPEWISRDSEGRPFPGKTFDAVWKLLCFNTPYLDYLCAQIEEVAEKFAASDGFFLDIILKHRCYCESCLAGMQDAGLDAKNEADADEFASRVLARYYERATASCKIKNSETRVFHNGGHIPKGSREFMKWNSHLEIESLPTGGWGYDHFPVSAKYAATTGMDFLGMTGKFHTTWGDFGGFKRDNALRYECDAMISFGAKCSVGDQLHPSGAMSEDTYNLIGAAYSQVEAKQNWCENAVPVSDIAIVSSEAWHAKYGRRNAGHAQHAWAEEGAARMLLELQQQFDVVDLERDLSAYKVVILPDEIVLEGDFAQKMLAFVQSGGKVLMSGQSGTNADNTAFVLDAGLEIVGRSEWNPDYIVPNENLPTSPVRGPIVVHGGAFDVRAQNQQVRVLAQRAAPYFNREWNHFCSHQHTPDEKTIEFPAATQNGNLIYFAHAIFTRYRFHGQPLYRDLVEDAIRILLPQPALETNLPTSARAVLTQQENSSRQVLHLLYAVPVLRGGAANAENVGQPIEVIEDLVPIHNLYCRVRAPHNVKSVRLVPQNYDLDFETENGVTRFSVPQILCHQMVELSY